MLKLKLQYFGHLMLRADSLEKTLMLRKIEGRKRRGWQRMRWLEGLIDSVDKSFSKVWVESLLMGKWNQSTKFQTDNACMFSYFSHVQLSVTSWTMACRSSVHGILQARILEWIAVSFSSDKAWSEWSEVTQSCPTLFNPMDFSLPGSSIHGIFQARVLEWGAIAFSLSMLSQC